MLQVDTYLLPYKLQSCQRIRRLDLTMKIDVLRLNSDYNSKLHT